MALLGSPSAAQVHEGVASCGGSTCHGRQAATGAVVRQNELQTWQDPASPAGAHSRAWRVLLAPESRRMAARLAIGAADQAPMCLSCHSDFVPAAQRGARFRIEDGVGCEACHGGSGARPDGSAGWLASHAAVGNSHAANVRAGLFPANDLVARANMCLDCHFGSSRADQFVTHRIMAAGHPRLSYELDLFTALQAHHDEDADYRARKPVFGGLKVWAVGQALASARQLRLFATRGTDGAFPEFLFFDCRTCHRSFTDQRGLKPLTRSDQWRPIAPGFPAFADENLILLEAAARVLAPAQAADLRARSAAFHRAFLESRPAADRAALQLAESADRLARAVAASDVDPAAAMRIVAAITEPSHLARVSEYQGGAQTLMAIETLVSSLVRAGLVSEPRARGLRPSLDEAHRQLKDANRWDAAAFGRTMTRLGAAARAML
ncbi:MAG: multiheme c-type cytochrome [Thermaurantiacus sp.]